MQLETSEKMRSETQSVVETLREEFNLLVKVKKVIKKGTIIHSKKGISKY